MRICPEIAVNDYDFLSLFCTADIIKVHKVLLIKCLYEFVKDSDF